MGKKRQLGKKGQHLILILFLLGCFKSGIAQNVERSFDTWWSNINKYRIDERLYASSEIHVRRTQGLDRWRQFLFRPAINYILSGRNHLAAGYSLILSYPYMKGSDAKSLEHNVWEQVTVRGQGKRLKYDHRYRLEQRFIRSPEIDEEGNVVQRRHQRHRFRYRLTLTIPLVVGANERFAIEFFDELWLNLFEEERPLSIDRNWVYGGIAYDLSDKARIGVGYMNQLLPRGPRSYSSSDIIQTTLSFDLDLGEEE